MPTVTANLSFPLPDPPNDSRREGEAALRLAIVAIDAYLAGFTGGGSGETFGVVFNGDGDVALRGDGTIVTKRN